MMGVGKFLGNLVTTYKIKRNHNSVSHGHNFHRKIAAYGRKPCTYVSIILNISSCRRRSCCVFSLYYGRKHR